MGGYAWVTLATNNSYSLGALVLAHSLKKANTAHKLAVLITPAVSQAMREQLQTVFDLVKVVDVLDSKDEAHLALMKRPELGITFTKIHCWRLVEFEKCVFLDADTLVVRNCDELFEREELSAAPDVSWPDCFNSGVFVYRPSVETFNKILQFAVENRSFDGGDQGLLNQFFSEWATEDIKKHLPFVYNLTSVAAYSYIPAFKHYGSETRIVHFIGEGKPWLQQLDVATRTVTPTSGSEHLAPLLQQWWDLFCEKVHPKLDKNLESCDDGMSHPPVEVNCLPNALTDEPETARSIEPCTPYREKDDFRQHNLPYQPFDVEGPSGELLNVEYLITASVPPAEPEPNVEEQPKQEEHITIHTTEVAPQEEQENPDANKPDEEIPQQQEEPPPPKDPFDYCSFVPDETCISDYLEKNVETYQPFDNHHYQHDSPAHREEPSPALPRFLTIPQNDQRQSGNIEPQERQESRGSESPPGKENCPPTPPREPTPPPKEPERPELSKSKSMSSFPPVLDSPPVHSIWKSQPDLNADPNRKYSMPKLKPLLPKQRSFSKSVPSAMPKVTLYTEFVFSSEYKEPIDLPNDKIGFVETLRRTKSDADIRGKFGPVPDLPSEEEVVAPVTPKRVPRHFDNEYFDLSQCRRQLGNKPKPKDKRKGSVHALPALKPIVPAKDKKSIKKRKSKELSPGDGGKEKIPRREPEKEEKAVIAPTKISTNGVENNVDEILERLRGFSKDYQHFFGVASKPRVVSCKNVTVQASEEDGGECGSSEAFDTFSTTINRKTQETQTPRKMAGDGLEFRQFRDYVTDQKKTSQKGLLGIQDILSEAKKERAVSTPEKKATTEGLEKVNAQKQLTSTTNITSTAKDCSDGPLRLSELNEIVKDRPTHIQEPEMSSNSNPSDHPDSVESNPDPTTAEKPTAAIHLDTSYSIPNYKKDTLERQDPVNGVNEQYLLPKTNTKLADHVKPPAEQVSNSPTPTAQQKEREIEHSTSNETATEQNPTATVKQTPSSHPETSNNMANSNESKERHLVRENGVVNQTNSKLTQPLQHSPKLPSNSVTPTAHHQEEEIEHPRTNSTAIQPKPTETLKQISPNQSDSPKSVEQSENPTESKNSEKVKGQPVVTRTNSKPVQHSAEPISASVKPTAQQQEENIESVTTEKHTQQQNKEIESELEKSSESGTTGNSTNNRHTLHNSDNSKDSEPEQEENPVKPEDILCVPDFETPRTSRVSPPNSKPTEGVSTFEYRASLPTPQSEPGETPENGCRDDSPGGAVRGETPPPPTRSRQELNTTSGIAGAIAQLNLEGKGQESPMAAAAASTAQEEYLRRQNWETGNMDYMGRDSFDNIWSKICQTIEGKEADEKAAQSTQPPESGEKQKEGKPAADPVAPSENLKKCPEFIETLPGEPAAGPVEDDEIIFSKPENKEKNLTNIAEEEEAKTETPVKLSDILQQGPPTGGKESELPKATPTAAPPAPVEAKPSPSEAKPPAPAPAEVKQESQPQAPATAATAPPAGTPTLPETKPQCTSAPSETPKPECKTVAALSPSPEGQKPAPSEPTPTAAAPQTPSAPVEKKPEPEKAPQTEQKQPETKPEPKQPGCATPQASAPPTGAQQRQPEAVPQTPSEEKPQPQPPKQPEAPGLTPAPSAPVPAPVETTPEAKPPTPAPVEGKPQSQAPTAPSPSAVQKPPEPEKQDCKTVAVIPQSAVEQKLPDTKPQPEAGKPEGGAVAAPQPSLPPAATEPEKKAEECKTVAIPSPPIIFPGAPFTEKGKKPEEKPEVKSEPIPLPPPDTAGETSKEDGKQKKGVFSKLLEMVGVAPKEKNGSEMPKSVFYDADESTEGEKQPPETEKPPETASEAKEPAGAEEKPPEGEKKTKMSAVPEVKQSTQAGEQKPTEAPSEQQPKPSPIPKPARKSPSPKLSIQQNTPETEVTTPTPPPQQDPTPRRDPALLKVDDTILDTPPVPEAPKETAEDSLKAKLSSEIEDMIGKAKSEVESMLQDAGESSDTINAMKLMMGGEQAGKPEEVEELRVTSEEERKRHKGEAVTSKLSDQILKAIPPPRRKAISEASASTSAIPKPSAPEQKSPASPGEGKSKPSKPSSIPVPPPRSRGKPTPPSPPKGKGKK